MTEYALMDELIRSALKEDLGSGDHSSLSCIPENAMGETRLLLKEEGILAGVEAMQRLIHLHDPKLKADIQLSDGTPIQKGDVAFNLSGPVRSLLSAERLLLNIMQRMSGIATLTRKYVDSLHPLPTKILDTRKTTPGFRLFEKWAVQIGGGVNHRMGLYDMIMLKDNHIDFAGGIAPAIEATQKYLEEKQLSLKIVVEARSMKEIQEILEAGGAHRILLDNLTPEQTREAVRLIGGRLETESSGGINLKTVRSYAECGVDFISVGALTHQINSLDMSLKAI